MSEAYRAAYKFAYDNGEDSRRNALARASGRMINSGDQAGAVNLLNQFGETGAAAGLETQAAEKRKAEAEGLQRLSKGMRAAITAGHTPQEAYDAAISYAGALGVDPKVLESQRQLYARDPKLFLDTVDQTVAQELEFIKSSDGSYSAVPKTGNGRPIFQYQAPTQDRYQQFDPHKEIRRIPGRPGGSMVDPGFAIQAQDNSGDTGMVQAQDNSNDTGIDANWLSGVAQAAPDARVTSGFRTPQRNAQVGGRPNSRHLSGQAVDLVPRPGETMAQLYARVNKIPGTRAINEGDHVHVQATGGQPAQASAPGAPELVRPATPKPTSQQIRLTPAEVTAAGYQPGSVVVRDSVTGEETVKQGPGGGSGKITDGQRHTAALTYRVVKANDRMNTLAERGLYKPATPTDSLFTRDRDGTIRLIARTDQDRQFLQAAKEWLLPVLRKDTGAAVTDGELREYMETYIPKYEDSQQVRWQKAQARNDAMNALYGEASAAYEDQFGAKPKWRVLSESARKPAAAKAPSSSVKQMSNDALKKALGL